jgi:hypothetical protein
VLYESLSEPEVSNEGESGLLVGKFSSASKSGESVVILNDGIDEHGVLEDSSTRLWIWNPAYSGEVVHNVARVPWPT